MSSVPIFGKNVERQLHLIRLINAQYELDQPTDLAQQDLRNGPSITGTDLGKDDSNHRAEFVPSPRVRLANRTRQHGEKFVAMLPFVSFREKSRRLKKHKDKGPSGTFCSLLFLSQSAKKAFFGQKFGFV